MLSIPFFLFLKKIFSVKKFSDLPKISKISLSNVSFHLTNEIFKYFSLGIVLYYAPFFFIFLNFFLDKKFWDVIKIPGITWRCIIQINRNFYFYFKNFFLREKFLRVLKDLEDLSRISRRSLKCLVPSHKRDLSEISRIFLRDHPWVCRYGSFLPGISRTSATDVP